MFKLFEAKGLILHNKTISDKKTLKIKGDYQLFHDSLLSKRDEFLKGFPLLREQMQDTFKCWIGIFCQKVMSF